LRGEDPGVRTTPGAPSGNRRLQESKPEHTDFYRVGDTITCNVEIRERAMKPRLMKSFALLFVGMLLGVSFVVSLRAGQEYRTRTGYAFWGKADGNVKFAYLLGYSDAEQMYRLVLDKAAKSICADAGKEWIEDFDRKIPMPNNITFKQTTDGIDDFYKDWRNQSIPLFLAQNIVRLQIAGRPQAEIEEATRKARESASNE
jgi:hypothetical protein